MEEKDTIRDLFQDRFSDFEGEVSPQVWDSIQSSLQGGVPASAATGFSTMAVVGMVAASLTAAVGFGYLFWDSNSDTAPVIENSLVEVQEDSVKTNLNEESTIEEVPTPIEEVINEENEISTAIKKDFVSETNLGGTAELKDEKQSGTPSSSNSVNDDSKMVSSPTEVPQEIEGLVTTPPTVNLADVSSVIASPVGGQVPLDVQFSTLAKAKTIKWDFDDGHTDNSVSPQHTYTRAGVYFVTMIAELETGEIIMDKAVVEVKPAHSTPEKTEAPIIRIPNVFTPNGDGTHDVLEMDCQNVKAFSMSIYSVNGSLVFHTENPNEFWDGKDRSGSIVEEGTYYYLVNAVGLDQKNYAPKGYITLRR